MDPEAARNQQPDARSDGIGPSHVHVVWRFLLVWACSVDPAPGLCPFSPRGRSGWYERYTALWPMADPRGAEIFSHDSKGAFCTAQIRRASNGTWGPIRDFAIRIAAQSGICLPIARLLYSCAHAPVVVIGSLITAYCPVLYLAASAAAWTTKVLAKQ